MKYLIFTLMIGLCIHAKADSYFDKLKNIFESADKPYKLEDLPASGEEVLKTWQECYSVKGDNTFQKYPGNCRSGADCYFIPVRVTQQLEVKAAIPAVPPTPGMGPLLPGDPGKPAQPAVYEARAEIAANLNESNIKGDWGFRFDKTNENYLLPAPEYAGKNLVQSWNGVWMRYFREYNGYLVEWQKDMQDSKNDSYIYCVRKNQNPLF